MLLHPHGYMVATLPDGKITEADTLQCVHCGRHWRVQPGSGNVSGYCSRCAGPVCGPSCLECVPAEQQLENLEQGRGRLQRPIIVPVGG